MKKVAIITGVSSGIGLATANYFFSKGYVVYGIARTPLKGKQYVCFSCDINDYANLSKTYKYIYEKEGQIDVLVNVVGINHLDLVENISHDDILKLINTNLTSTMISCKEIIPFMKKNIEGKIINLNDMLSFYHKDNNAIYNATKAGLEAFSISLNNELKKFNIHVCSLIPVNTKSNFAKEKHNKEEDPLISAKAIYKIANLKNPPLRYIVGFKNNFRYFLIKLLPIKLTNFFINKKKKEKEIIVDDED